MLIEKATHVPLIPMVIGVISGFNGFYFYIKAWKINPGVINSENV